MITKTTKENLCDTCINSFATCQVDETDIEFGDGIGNDNIIDCDLYEPLKIKF